MADRVCIKRDSNAACVQYKDEPGPPIGTATPGTLPHTGPPVWNTYEIGALSLLVVVIGVCGLVFTGEWWRAWRGRRAPVD